MVASGGQAKDGKDSNLSASSSKMSQVSQGEYRVAPQDGPSICFLCQGKNCLVFGGDPDVLHSEDP